MDIFDRKFEKEGLTHKEALKDHMAHYGVLRELAQERENSGNSDPNMGRYGPGTSKLEIQPLIQVYLLLSLLLSFLFDILPYGFMFKDTQTDCSLCSVIFIWRSFFFNVNDDERTPNNNLRRFDRASVSHLCCLGVLHRWSWRVL